MAAWRLIAVTGAAQLVEIVEEVRRIEVPQYVVTPEPEHARRPLFDDVADDELLAYGGPVRTPRRAPS